MDCVGCGFVVCWLGVGFPAIGLFAIGFFGLGFVIMVAGYLCVGLWLLA